jgi:serine/threonine protein kinase
MPSRQDLLPFLLDKDYCESFNKYVPNKSDCYDLVAPRLPAGWRILRHNIWFCCSSLGNQTPRQGWKIHVSATIANARDVLGRVAQILLDRADTDFKFALDLSVLFLLNSKNWSRGSSGKFITVYPRDNRHFLNLIEQLHVATEGLRGPYILSDYRFQSSGVIFYRYGGMRIEQTVDIRGEGRTMLVDPQGVEVPDERHSFPVTPAWAAPILPAEPMQASDQAQALKGGRYKVTSAMAFSNAGGVYCGVDLHDGRKVVIKEARPLINAGADGYDAVALLKKEHRLLLLIAGTGIAPRPIDLFQEWEHWFLVEEFVEGSPLSVHASENNILLRTRPTAEDFETWRKGFYSICDQLIRTVRKLHSQGIVFADLSPNNLLVESATGDLKLIDFEGAYQLGVDRPSSVYTPGFVSQRRLAGFDVAFEDDYYAVGAVLMACLFPVTRFFHLKPQARREMMASIQRDAQLPPPVAEFILRLMDPDPARRQLPATMADVLESFPAEDREPEKTKAAPDYQSVVVGITEHVNHVASFSRQDRLFPADSQLFATNPVSLAHGAAGVGYALSRLTGRPQPAIADWILRRKITAEKYSPGLYVGMAGIAWCLLEMGILEEATKMFQTTLRHRLLGQSPDLFFGLAGWGMASLRFFLETDDEFYLEQARHAGYTLLAGARRCDAGLSWGPADEPLLGLAHGASGIALFLLYLYLATDEEEFLVAGQHALDFDLSFAVTTKDRGYSWRQSVKQSSVVYPYWRFGSAGIGIVVVRYHRLLGSSRYGSILDSIFLDTNRQYAVFPGHFMGLTGMGAFLMDMHEHTQEDRFLDAAHQLAGGILRFSIDRNGVAFPGDSLARLSCDYGTGSTGVGLFLNRLLGRQQGDFMLDSLFARNATRRSLGQSQKQPILRSH